MDEKEKVIQHFLDKGIQASYENRMIVLRTDNPDFTKEVIEKELQSLNYKNSYGIFFLGEAADYHMKKHPSFVTGDVKRVVKKTKNEDAELTNLEDDTLELDDLNENDNSDTEGVPDSDADSDDESGDDTLGGMNNLFDFMDDGQGQLTFFS